MNKTTVTIWVEGRGALEYHLNDRAVEILKDCLEAGLETYEDEGEECEETAELEDLANNL